MDLIFKNTPWGDVRVNDTMAPWNQKMWLDILATAGCQPQKAAWTPSYDGPFTIKSENGVVAALSQFNFASESTARELMNRYGAERVEMRPFEGSGGPNVGPLAVRWLVWPDAAIKAGLLAEEFTRNPEDQFPGVAHAAVLAAIKRHRESDHSA